MWYSNDDSEYSVSGMLQAIAFYDKKGLNILKAGDFRSPNNQNITRFEIVLDDDERVVGVKSGRRGRN